MRTTFAFLSLLALPAGSIATFLLFQYWFNPCVGQGGMGPCIASQLGLDILGLLIALVGLTSSLVATAIGMGIASGKRQTGWVLVLAVAFFLPLAGFGLTVDAQQMYDQGCPPSTDLQCSSAGYGYPPLTQIPLAVGLLLPPVACLVYNWRLPDETP
jgi:hypothetical protein